MKTKNHAIFFLTLWLAAMASLPAQADEKPRWELGLGFGALAMPDYRGSDQTRGYLLPIPYAVYRGERLRVDRQGIVGRLFQRERARLTVSMDGGVPVKSDQNDARTGMSDLDPTLEVGPALEICLIASCKGLDAIEFRLPARAVIAVEGLSHASNIGYTLSPHLLIDFRNLGSQGWDFGFLAGPVFGSDELHDYYYAVSTAFATPSRPVYDARRGYAGMRYTMSLSKRTDHRWVGFYMRYDDLSSARFEDSPLVRAGHSFQTGLAFTWVLRESRERVPDVR